MQKHFQSLLLILLLPLLFINVRNSHDWGDDFAQYLIQSKNIIDGRPQTENGLKYEENASGLAVQAYPVGFPLLMSPVVAHYGMEIKSLLILESILLIFISLLCWNFFRNFFDKGLALLMVLFFAYHAFSIDLKGQILSEIPFTLVLILLVLLLRSPKKSFRYWLIVGVLCALLMSIRIVGILMLPAIAGFLLYRYWTNKHAHKLQALSEIKIFLTMTISSIAVFIFLNVCLFNIPVNSFLRFYLNAGSNNDFTFWGNLKIYLDKAGAIFRFPFLQYSWWKIIVGFLILTGFLRAFIKINSAECWFFLLYVLILGIYPYTSGSFRFLFPVFPFLILYFFEGLNIVATKSSKVLDKKVMYLVCLILVFAQIIPLYQTWQERDLIVNGPQSPASKEMFQYIRNNTAENAVVIFPRARAMALYGERTSSYLLKNNTPTENAALFNRIKTDYLVLPKGDERNDLYDPALWRYFEKDKGNLQQVWQNEGFEVYQFTHF